MEFERLVEIPNYSNIEGGTGVLFDDNDGHTWSLYLKPKRTNEMVNFLAIRIGLWDWSLQNDFKVQMEICAIDEFGNAFKENGIHSYEFNFGEKSRDQWRLMFMESSKVLTILHNNTLKLRIRILINPTSGYGRFWALGSSNEELERCRWELVKVGFQDMRKDQALVDFAIITASKRHGVHKALLLGSSPVFRAMVMAGMSESVENTVRITDFHDDVVEGMIDYLYLGTTAKLSDYAEQLLGIAEKYDLKGLKTLCEKRISTILTADNCSQLLVLADLHNATQLKNEIGVFFRRNKEAVERTESFLQLKSSNPAVVRDLHINQ